MSRNMEALEIEVEDLKAQVAEREDEIEDLKVLLAERDDEKEEFEAALEDERQMNESARDLHAALVTYLSWVDSPPTDFDRAQYEAILRRFRAEVNDAMLRMGVG